MSDQPIDPAKEFERLIRHGFDRHQTWQVFADFCELAAMTFAQVVHKTDAREARYMATVGRYSKEEAASLSRLLGVDRHGS